MGHNCIFRLLTEEDASALRAIRLEALQRFPLSYTGTYEAEVLHDTGWFASLIASDMIIGVWHPLEGLVGTACLTGDKRPRNEHKATLRMVYIRSEHQRGGLARSMLLALQMQTEHLYEQWLLSVEAGNSAAIRLYKSLGFMEYGREPKATKLLDGRYLDDILMIKMF